MEQVALITLHAAGFPPIPCKPIVFNGTREQALAHANQIGADKAAFFGADRVSVELL